MRIYLIRHGDPDYETDSLTARGRSEALALSEYMATLGVDAIYSSPLGRARETARYTEQKTGLKAAVENWTAELPVKAIDGSGHMAWDMSPSSLRTIDTHVPEPWAAEYKKIERNSDAWFAKLGWTRKGFEYVQDSGISPDSPSQVALFCHGGFGLTWLSHLLQIPMQIMWASFFLHTTSVTTLLLEEREKGVATLRVIGMSELPHLYKQGLRPGRMGIKANYY